MNPFDIVKHLSSKTKLEFEDIDYNPMIINKALSLNITSLYFAEVINNSQLSIECQRDFYYHGLPKESRRGTWVKTKINEPSALGSLASMSSIKIIKSDDRDKWNLVTKYKIGKDRNYND